MLINEKDAAWGAHFMADMFVCYHVVGCPVEILKTYADENGVVDGEKISGLHQLTGEINLGYTNAGKSQQITDMAEQAKRFLQTHEKDKTTDWFDPWYWNGNGIYHIDHYIHSSHVQWEGSAHLKTSDYHPKFHPDWSNPEEPTFTRPWDRHMQLTHEFARNCAKQTRKDLQKRFESPATGFTLAVDGVYTLWRSLISALGGSIDIKRKEDKISISFSVTNRDAADTTTNVQARLMVLKDGEIFLRQDKTFNVAPSLGPQQQQSVDNGWEIEKEKLAAEGNYVIRLEMIGRYSVPDAQYGVFEQELKAKWPRYYAGKAKVFMTGSNSKEEWSVAPRPMSPSPLNNPRRKVARPCLF